MVLRISCKGNTRIAKIRSLIHNLNIYSRRAHRSPQIEKLTKFDLNLIIG
jgi:hypothetical protein